MTQTATDYLEAIDHIPVGGKLYLEGVGWDEYEELLEELEGKRYVRISYDNGRMEIMTLSPEHEEPSRLFMHFIQILTEELDLEFISIGSTTLRRKSRKQGKDPDDCFYIGALDRIIGKKRLDLDYQVEFHRLAGKRYELASTSALFPFLQPTVVTEYLPMGYAQGINAMRRAFREWVHAHKP